MLKTYNSVDMKNVW